MGFTILSSLLEILNQTFNIFFRNGKLMPSITLLVFFLNSIIMLSYLYSNKISITNYSNKLNDLILDQARQATYNPDFENSYQQQIVTLMKHEARIFVFAYLIFAIATYFTSFFFAIATTLVSAESLVAKQLCAKELVIKIRESCRRAFVTLGYTILLNLGYAIFVLALIILPLELILLDSISLSDYQLSTVSIIVFVLAVILYFYLTVVWMLAFVVSLLEEKSGFEAFGRASELAKGLKLQGFVLNLLYNGLSYATFRVWMMSLGNKKFPLLAEMLQFEIAPVVLLVAVASLIKAFSLISYAVLYFKGKKLRGEEIIELQGYSVEYTKVFDSA